MKRKLGSILLMIFCCLLLGSLSVSAATVTVNSKPFVTVVTKTTTTKKTTTLKKAAAKTKSVVGKTTTTQKNTIKKNKAGTLSTTTFVQTKSTPITKYTKGSKKAVVTTKKVTTTRTSVSKIYKCTYTNKKNPAIRQIAPLADKKLLDAFETLKFQVVVKKMSGGIAGHMDGIHKQLALRQVDDTVYHELGHFLANLSGNTDRGSAFSAIYNSEKDKYLCYNKGYVCQSPSEYFAESYKDYVLFNADLKKTRPKTYAFIKSCVNGINQTRVDTLSRAISLYQQYGTKK